jgi:hypothetical protein
MTAVMELALQIMTNAIIQYFAALENDVVSF